MTVDLMIKVKTSVLLSFRGADRSILQNNVLWATAAKAQHDASMSSHDYTCINPQVYLYTVLELQKLSLI